MKKILFITTNDVVVWGGSEELWYATALEFLKHGYHVGISVQDRAPLPSKIEAIRSDGNVHLFLKSKSVYFLPERIFNRFVPSRHHIVKPSRYIKDILGWRPDLVVISQGNNMDGLDMMEFFHSNRIPYVNIVQAVYEGIWPNTERAERMERSYNASLANYFVSESNLKLTSLQAGSVIPRSKIVRNPFNVPYGGILPFPQLDVYRLACVARLEFYAKGQDVLLQVMNDDKWKSRDLVVNFFGKGVNDHGIKKLIRYFGLKNVSVAGHARPTDIWREHHALVLPSRFEGLPLSLVEAMLCRRFGIVTNVSGNGEVIIDNVNGFLAEAPQAVYLDQAMERAWQKRDQWQHIGEEARAYIQTMVSENPGLDFFKMLQCFL